jgi:hypothetical protein
MWRLQNTAGLLSMSGGPAALQNSISFLAHGYVGMDAERRRNGENAYVEKR